MNVSLSARPFKIYDFYEPRAADNSKYIIYPESFGTSLYFSSNYIRKFALDLNPFVTFFNENDRTNYGFYISPRYRFNDHLAIVYGFKFNRQK